MNGENPRAGDSFELFISVADGSGTLSRTRDGHFNRKYLTRESIYHNIEK